jgi:signal transduction histidine kinase/ActR/RegA family two-component response regulator
METGVGAPAADEAQAWRERLSLRLLRSLVVIAAVGFVIVGLTVQGTRARVGMMGLVGAAILIVAIAAISKRPTGAARSWIVVLASTVVSLSGFAFGGFLSGPGACLAVTLMLTGLLLGRRAMIGLTIATAAILAVLAWAIANHHFGAPDPRNSDMTSAFNWGRTLGVTFLAIILFGVLMVAVVNQMERAVQLARQETVRRETAERARAEAERASNEGKQLEVVGRLAAGIAHDFNNNLTAIMGCAELLQAEVGPGGRELADSILQSSRRVADLTRQLLVYSRKAQMQQVPTDVHAIVREAISLVRRSIHPNVRIVTNLDARNATVLADVALLQNAVLNLLVNASDAMPDGGILTVTTASVDDGSPTQTILLEVSDTGHGIERDLVSQVFEPFFTTKPLGQGTGLGLAAVAGTIKTHGGRVEVESELGIGSVFRVYLPLTPSATVRAHEGPDLVVRGRGEILLVEDDSMVGLTAAATLRSFGYDVVHAVDGHAAIERVRAEPTRFGLVILDLRMPGLSGEATFDALRALAPTLKILIWSGYVAGHDVSAILQRGAVGFVQKPYRVADLSRVVAEALGVTA